MYRRVDVGIDPYEVERKCPISIVGIDPYEVERKVQFLLWDDAHNVPIWRANADCTTGKDISFPNTRNRQPDFTKYVNGIIIFPKYHK